MKPKVIVLGVITGLLLAALIAQAAEPCSGCGPLARLQARILAPRLVEYNMPNSNYSWHGPYYNVGWGVPVALVVPPTVAVQAHYSWGVGGSYTTPICNQFSRNWPGPGSFSPSQFLPTPSWPSSTDQFGIYYVRGPW